MKYFREDASGFARCKDCIWKTYRNENAQRIAKKHAKRHGHLVEGKLEIAFKYDGRKDKTEDLK